MAFLHKILPWVSDKKIDSFEVVTLHLSGMRHTTEYEIVMKDGMAEVIRYGIHYVQNEDRRVPEEKATCNADDVLKLLNDCRVLSWDGFYGPHPRHVLDGTMFTLDATVNGDRKIHAHGSQNFPRRYHDFTDWLYKLFEGSE